MDELEQLGYVDVETMTDGGGSYDWSEMHVYTKDGRVFVNTQRGCSCYSWETPDADALIEVPDIAAAKREWTDMMGSYASDTEWLDAVRPEFVKLGLR